MKDTQIPLTQRSFNLQVSCGEALDKLSILEIKLSKINDHRAADVQKEYDILSPILNPIVATKCQFLYSLLKKINLSIWDKQDLFRYEDVKNTETKVTLCLQIIEENDQRFRIKNKINYRLNSDLKEQKGYKMSRALVIPPQDIRDQIYMISTVRYLSIVCDEVHLVANDELRPLYADDPTITIIKDYDSSWPEKDIFRVQSCPDSLMGSGLPTYVFWNYFHIAEVESADPVVGKYIFIHPGAFDVTDVERHSGVSKDDVLYLDPVNNQYTPDHKFYITANKIIACQISHYIPILINASKIYVSDDWCFALALHLGIKTTACYVRSNNISHLWQKTGGFDPSQKGYGSDATRKVFSTF